MYGKLTQILYSNCLHVLGTSQLQTSSYNSVLRSKSTTWVKSKKNEKRTSAQLKKLSQSYKQCNTDAIIIIIIIWLVWQNTSTIEIYQSECIFTKFFLFLPKRKIRKRSTLVDPNYRLIRIRICSKFQLNNSGIFGRYPVFDLGFEDYLELLNSSVASYQISASISRKIRFLC